jgi:hypothetical protein
MARRTCTMRSGRSSIADFGGGNPLTDRREIDFEANGKQYKLSEKPAVLLVR